MKLGVLQGRLQPPVDGHIQEFPTKWFAEFKLLKDLDLHYLEWIVTKPSFSTNPILSRDYNFYGFPISSICVDHIIDPQIQEIKFLKERLDPVCDAALQNNIPCITIPLLEESSMEPVERRKQFGDAIETLGAEYPSLQFSFEAELGIAELTEIISRRDNFYVTYDTGNITSYGLDHAEYVEKLATKINNVHIKDRTFAAQTVAPLTGDTDFKTIFTSLKSIEYQGPYILQTAREEDGLEKQTIRKHKRIFEDLYAKAI